MSGGVPDRAGGMASGHVIVCGLHPEGLGVIEQLHASGVPTVVIDDRPDRRLVPTVQGWRLTYLERDSRSPDTLRAAGIDTAMALISVDTDDLHALETTLLARELRPDLRVVAQIRNPAVGRALAETGAAVLDVARLSAPSVVEACLRARTHEVELDGEIFLAATVRSARSGSLRELYGALTPLAMRPAGAAQDLVIGPGRDAEVAVGDTVTLFGTPAELRAVGVRPHRAVETGPQVGLTGARYAGAAASRRPDDVARPRRGLLAATGSWLTHLVRSVGEVLDVRIRMVLLGLVGVLAVSAVVLTRGYVEPNGRGMTVLDAVYFTIETIGTVGYGDFSFRDQPSWLRIYAIGLMLIGAALATVLFALLTNVLVGRQLEESLGRLRVTRLSGHVIVVGLGSVGIRVVELLTDLGVRVVAIERDETNPYLVHAKALGVPVVAADATLADTMDAVHLPRARAVAVVTSDDLVNIETGLAVRDHLAARTGTTVGAGRRRAPVVLRLFDHSLARTVQRSFGFDSTRSTAALAAPWFVGAALGLEVLSTFYVDDTPVLVARLTVSPGRGLDGLSMQELSGRTRVVALRRAGGVDLEHPPRRATRLAAGDVAYVVGPYAELLDLLRQDRVPGCA